KSDKYLYEEYVEKALKLVLKVGGNEVTKLSTGSPGHDSTLFEDKNDHDKHKWKERKKGEKEVPGEEKGRKWRSAKEDKKKRDRDRVETDAEKDLQCRAPVRLDLPPEKPLTSSLAKQLQRKDPGAFFSFPVTDCVAPGCSMIIKRPMDFSTMQGKIKTNDYQSTEELKDNFQLMCTNAMIYNKPETIYYKAAKKLLHSGMKILSQERIKRLTQSIDFMSDLQKDRTDTSQSGEDRGCWREDSGDAETQAFKSPSKENKDKDMLEDKFKSNNLMREQEQLDRKLTKWLVNSQCEFERTKPDGTRTLGLLHPVDPIVGEPGYCPVRPGMTTGRLQSGVNTLQGFKEDKRNEVTPVLHLNYQPYGSYVPHYDSTFANISKDDSTLIFQAISASMFLATCQDYPYVMADSLLDVLTKGGRSRTLQKLEMSSPKDEGCTRTLDTAKEKEITEIELIALKAVANFGIPVEVFDFAETEVFQKKLDETTRLLRELQEAQNERLSTRPPPNMISLGNLEELAQQVTPGDIISMYGVQKAMGISIPSPIVENNFVDLTEDTEEPKKTDVAEHGAGGS
uniref:Bromo domain-containing protein n=1 Tax=Aotus nancymaae TaxID=37293 RepID=A0A2K5EPF3_AOTNA